MNKLIIGLLIIAAGAGVYFLLSKKKAQYRNSRHQKRTHYWYMEN